MPEDQDAVITVLRTLPGMDPRAPDIYRILGPKALEILMIDPDQVVKKVPGVGQQSALRWQRALKGFG